MSSENASPVDAPHVNPARAEGAQGNEASQCLVVAIGTSAGGLAACTTLLQHVPIDTGLAFVVVQHLDPNHESHLVELLAKATAMPVVKIEDGMAVLPDRVHVIPADAGLGITGDVLQLLPRGADRPPMPIDGFLRALAEDRGNNAVAVILSGSGTDGSLGVQAIREHGGITMAQEPTDAAFDGMPRSAVATGCIDRTMTAEQLGGELAHICTGLRRGRGPADQDAMRDLLSLLRAATGVDFTQYRRTTVGRRLWRRITLQGLSELRQYVDHVRANPGELQELARDLLISVTRFFRDPHVFAFLAQTVFPDLIRRAASDGQVRIWVPGCSTGEEAYSLAITFVETASRMHSTVTCQVFATDINETVLDKARRATYLENIAADVSSEQLARFFTRSDGGYRINRALRDLCVFSRHDLLCDPPLSRMDMVSCRNLLIYFEQSQRHALSLLHFALEPRGYLLLGRSETAASCPELFEAADKEMRLFQARRPVAGSTLHRSGWPRDARHRQHPNLVAESADTASAYEELIAANEELQSLNEELESSKEEIESINEELTTLNQELRSRNEALHVANAFAEATLDTVRSALLVLDRKQRVLNANRSFYRMFHLTAEEVEHRPLVEVSAELFGNPAIQRVLEQAQGTGHRQEDIEVGLDAPGREHRILLMNVRPFAPGDLMLLSVDDVTQLRQIEADQRQSQKMEAVGLLAAGVAHDFNNLLTVVLSGTQLTLDSLPVDSEARTLLADVASAAQRAADLTHQLLSYAGKSRVLVERVVLSDTVAQAANLLHASIPMQVQLRLDLERDLQPLLADPSQMHQIVGNLLKNAIEAVGNRPGTVLVRTGKQRVSRGEIEGFEPNSRIPPGDYVFLEVQDTGLGMSAATRRRMFDPFFTTKFTGRGLGLAAVQGIVRQHNGTIAVHSVPDRGTSIRVLLAMALPGRTVAAQPESKAPPTGSGTVLVVDDEPMVLGMTQAALQSFGYEVLAASSGAQALEFLRQEEHVGAVVLDATMPGMDGVETLHAMRALRPDLPVLVCSGLGDAATEDAFADSVVNGFLHKPYSIRQLREKLAACMSSGN